MLREHCSVGMKVMFGRPNGEKTLGEVVKTNPSKAKVKTLAARGSTSPAGAVWTVPYSLMTPAGVAMLDEANGKPDPSVTAAVTALVARMEDDLPVTVSDFMPHGDRLIMEAIVDTYFRLEPEVLTCDGELPAYKVMAVRNSLNRRLKHLFGALGRPVSERAAFQWDQERRAKQAV